MSSSTIKERLVIFIFAITSVHCALEAQQSADPADIPHYACARQCAYQVATSEPQFRFHHSSMSPYFKCMAKCVGKDWILFESNQTCLKEFLESGSLMIACKPQFVKVHEFRFQLHPDKHKVGYILFIWKPCPYGRSDVRGYQISTNGGSILSDCWRLQLSRPLNGTEEMVFTALYPTKVEYSASYSGYISSIPYTVADSDRFTKYLYNTQPCVSPTDNICGCVASARLSQPNVTVSGYSVTVSVAPLPKCFQTHMYTLFIAAVKRQGKDRGRRLQFYNLMENRVVHGKNVSYTFHHVYPVSPEFYMTAGSIVYMINSSPLISRDNVTVKAWVGKVSVHEERGSGAVLVSFGVSPPRYSIRNYSVMANFHPNGDDGVITAVNVRSFTRSEAKNGVISFKYYNLTQGLWSFQVREIHDYIAVPAYHRVDPSLYEAAEWSPRTEFRILSNWERYANSTYIPVIAVISFVVFLVAAIVVFLYLWKRGLCSRVRYYVPSGVAKWLDSQTTELSPTTVLGIRSKTVLLVWQADTRSSDLAEKHANVVRHLAAFLCSVCGLDVVLDMFEENQVSTAHSKWMYDSYERSHFVVFLCPHFPCDLEPEDALCRPLVGDFSYVFRYLEPHFRDRRKFVTALLPYSDVASCSASKWLVNCTRVFKLMDQIDDLYFHIQERSKVNLMGKISVEFVNRKDYVETPQGSAYARSVSEFLELHRSWDGACKQKKISFSTTSLTSSGASHASSSEYQASSSGASSLLHSSRDNVVPLSPEDTPVIVENTLDVEPPSGAKRVCRKVKEPIRPPPPLVANPEEQLRLLNFRNSADAGVRYSEEFCPFHSKAVSSFHHHSSDDGYAEPRTDELRSASSEIERQDHDEDESILNFLLERSLVPSRKPPLVQLSVQQLPVAMAASEVPGSETPVQADIVLHDGSQVCERHTTV